MFRLFAFSSSIYLISIFSVSATTTSHTQSRGGVADNPNNQRVVGLTDCGVPPGTDAVTAAERFYRDALSSEIPNVGDVSYQFNLNIEDLLDPTALLEFVDREDSRSHNFLSPTPNADGTIDGFTDADQDSGDNHSREHQLRIYGVFVSINDSPVYAGFQASEKHTTSGTPLVIDWTYDGSLDELSFDFDFLNRFKERKNGVLLFRIRPNLGGTTSASDWSHLLCSRVVLDNSQHELEPFQDKDDIQLREGFELSTDLETVLSQQELIATSSSSNNAEALGAGESSINGDYFSGGINPSAAGSGGCSLDYRTSHPLGFVGLLFLMTLFLGLLSLRRAESQLSNECDL